ncbi:Fringe-like, partial [Halocaridina rubra]
PVFLGHGLHDAAETIIHHFDHVDEDKPFLFPDARAGFVLSTTLVSRLCQKWSEVAQRPKMDFTIDAQYEFARFIESAGTLLLHSNDFCLEFGTECAIVFNPRNFCVSIAGVMS